MDDDESFMQLVLSNAQSELSEIEQGRHVVTAIERGHSGGRGKTGGLREYARMVGKDRTLLQQRAKAYAVWEKVARLSPLSDDFGYGHLLEQRRDAYLVWAKVANSLPLSGEDSGLSYSNLLEISTDRSLRRREKVSDCRTLSGDRDDD